MATSKYGGDQHHLTAYSQNPRGYERSNQTSGIRGTLERKPPLPEVTFTLLPLPPSTHFSTQKQNALV